MRLKIAAIALSLGLLAGCAFQGGQNLQEDRRKMAEVQDLKKRTFSQREPVEVFDAFYFGSGKPVPLPETSNLPEAFKEVITLIERPLPLASVVSLITEESGIPIRLSPQVTEKYVKKSDETIRLSFSDTLERCLDAVASHFGLNWYYGGGFVEFFQYRTHTFSIVALPGKVSQKAVITNASKTKSGEGAAGDQESETAQETSVEEDVAVWDEVVENIRSMLSSKDARVVANRVAGTVTVTDTPAILAQVTDYVEQINAKMARQVAITVKVWSLRSTKTLDIGVTLDAIFEDMNRQFGVQLFGASPFEFQSGTGSLAATILESPNDRRMAQWTGSNFLLRSLDQYGDVNLITSGSGITLNNQPMPIQNVSRTAYLAESSTTVTSDVGTTVELTPGVVTTGFSMSVTPHILDNHRVALQYTVTLSNLDNLATIESGGSSIQTPEVSTRSFLQRVAMPVGSTLVLAGFEQTRNRDNKAVGLSGYSRQDEATHESIVIVITVNEVAGA